ncbi:MAG: HepT-like ribonuclease domain-containing protein, partial [Campylobacterota bacterium]|nr:HepT-like ribonuclease domain-containing protein [Campylobacterota bacterium]
MFKRDSSLYIIDIFIAHNKISRYTSKFNSADELLWSELEWDATMRELEIIGEATNTLIKLETLDNNKFRKIVDFRNIIIHGYFGIDENEVWDVIQNKISFFIKD